LLHVLPTQTPKDVKETMRQTSLNLLQKVNTQSEVIILKSDDSINAISKTSAGYDLLILGTPQKDNWISVLVGTGKDKFAEKSACSVLRLTMKGD
ncbi:hypothetical protein MNBD_BACTEROID02-100, partial [hydrothermal vent metagenome]